VTQPETLTFVGLALTLVGATLLFFYGAPRKKFQHVFIGVDSIRIADPLQGERLVPDAEWKEVAKKFQARARVMNRAGFASVAVGTLLQMIAIVCET
jgi:uncharacterized protein YjeT (DUF2065 family)